jgi:hypothetical protein
MANNGVWVFQSPEDRAKEEKLKKKVEKTVSDWVTKRNKTLIKNVHPEFGYLDHYTYKWRSDSIYINEVYKYDSPQAIAKEMEHKLARFDMYGDLSWSLSYMRHNGKWVMISSGGSFEDCFEMFLDSPLFEN